MQGATATAVDPLPTEFADLVRMYPPQAMHDAVDRANATELIEAILRVPARSPGQLHYLETLTILATAYDREHDPINTSDTTGLDSLRYVVNESGTTTADLAGIMGTDEPSAAAVLAGTEPITDAHAAALGRRFHVNAGLFL